LLLLGLSALEGQMLGGSAAVPFLLDVEVHVSINLVAEQLVASIFPSSKSSVYL
jgi:hypothetical protein